MTIDFLRQDDQGNNEKGPWQKAFEATLEYLKNEKELLLEKKENQQGEPPPVDQKGSTE